MTSQLDAIQKTLGIRIGSGGARAYSIYSTASPTAGDAFTSPRPISSVSPENLPKDPACTSDVLSFYRTSHTNDILEPPVALGDIIMDIDQVKELFTQ